MIGAQADGHYDVTAYPHLSNPIQHLRSGPRCRDHYHLWLRSIGECVVRYDLQSASDTDRLGTIRHGIEFKGLHFLHAPAPGRQIGEREDLHGADKIDRLSPPLPYDEGDRYLAVGWWNQPGGRHSTRARRLLGCQSCYSKVQNRKKTGGDGRTCTGPYETPARQSLIRDLFLLGHSILHLCVKSHFNGSLEQRWLY